MASKHEPILIDYEELDFDPDSEDELELLDCESDPPDTEIITIEDEDAALVATPKNTQNKLDIRLPDIEVESCKLPDGTTVVRGATVELKDRSKHESGKLHSGDFIRVLHITRNLETDEVSLKGLRLRRAKYLGPMLSWKLNELVLVLHIREHEEGPIFLRGMVDVALQEVLCVRDCVLTNKTYPALSFRELGATYIQARTKEEATRFLFHQGQLVCRKLNILFVHKNGKAYSGEVRQLNSHEADPDHRVPVSLLRQGASQDTSIQIDESEEGYENACKPKTRPLLSKSQRYTFGDCFSGAGGASQGAVQAGLIVLWGLDHDEAAMDAYTSNHLGALPIMADAHDFPPQGLSGDDLHVDILHLSPPCCYWSPAHTHEGRNDQANYEAIFTVGPILAIVKPRVATLEQTFGLATYKEHKNNFLLLMHDILGAGYNLRYKVVNMADFGLPQQRKRLLMIAARIGEPLPPFPRPTHGGAGSGLGRYVSVADALEPLERLGARALGDPYHQLQSMKVIDKDPYDPHTSLLKGCITTGGGTNYHYSGIRKFTPRELSLLQTFPMNYQFSGSKGKATKQVGNAYPPVMATLKFKTIAKTLEAFDHGFLDAEDDVDDIDMFLNDKGIKLPETNGRLMRSPYRYLVGGQRIHPQHPCNPRVPSAIFRHSTDIAPRSRQRFTAPLSMPVSRERQRVQAAARLAAEDGDIMILD